MKRMESWRKIRRWVRGLMACGGRRLGEMRCAGSDREDPDSQLMLPGMALRREWTYGTLTRE